MSIIDKMKGVSTAIKEFKYLKHILVSTGVLAGALTAGNSIVNRISIKRMQDDTIDLEIQTELQSTVKDLKDAVEKNSKDTVNAFAMFKQDLSDNRNRMEHLSESIANVSDSTTKTTNQILELTDKNRSAIKSLISNKSKKDQKDIINGILGIKPPTKP